MAGMILFSFLNLLLLVVKFLSLKSQGIQGKDSYTYLILAREIRESGQVPKVLPYLVIDRQLGAPFDYPPLFFWVLSFCPPSWLEKNPFAVQFSLDMVNGLLLQILAFALSGSAEISLLTGFLYWSNPQMTNDTRFLTSRVFGNICFNASFIAFVVAVSGYSPAWLLLWCLAGGALLFSHKFEIQTMIAVSAALALATGQPLFLLGFPGLVAMNLLLSGRRYWLILTGHLRLLHWTWGNLRAFFSDSRGLPPGNTPRPPPNPIAALLLNFGKQFAYNPMYVYLAAVIWKDGPPMLHSLETVFLVWILTGFVFAWIIQSFPPLFFIGEGCRYNLQSVFPVAFLSAVWSTRGGWLDPWFLATVLLGLAISCQRLMVRGGAGDPAEDDLRASASRLSALPQDTFLVWPETYLNMLAYHCRKTVMGGLSTVALAEARDFLPTVTVPFRELYRRYRIQGVLLRKGFRTPQDLDLQEADLLFESACFQVFSTGVP